MALGLINPPTPLYRHSVVSRLSPNLSHSLYHCVGPHLGFSSAVAKAESKMSETKINAIGGLQLAQVLVQDQVHLLAVPLEEHSSGIVAVGWLLACFLELVQF